MKNITNSRIAAIGLGYVGLPLARLFATKYTVVGFDINEARVKELMAGHDSTLEVEDDILQAVLIREIRPNPRNLEANEIRPNPRNLEANEISPNPRNPETNPRNPKTK